MSWVFLTKDRVYKLKKPVKYPFLDFSTLSARRADCLEEIRLNRRLAADIYVGIVPLVIRSDGELELNGAGEPVEWLVEMRRIPDDLMLDRALAKGAVTEGQIAGIAELLSRFYNDLRSVPLSEVDYVGHFVSEQKVNGSVLRKVEFAIPITKLSAVLEPLESVLANDPDLLGDRARGARIVEGHGDLRPEHVCLTDPPVIIDCLEFNRMFRLVDPVDELAFLAMECQRLGAPWVKDLLFSRYYADSSDQPPDRVLAFYTAYRACLRARLALAHLLEPEFKDHGKWKPLAISYLDIAEKACLSLRPPAGR